MTSSSHRPISALCGSHLLTGQPLYLWVDPVNQTRQWRGHVSQATPIKDSERDTWFELARIDAHANLVVDPYWITLAAPGELPTRRREQIRVSGPSVRPDLTAAPRVDTASTQQSFPST